ncbi:nucleolus and neural progenitor protein isoform X2 [Melanotaenia boesemani]|nr:nucleolus and neural progenitor protein isoform X2 [Melanotaenia boesemani]
MLNNSYRGNKTFKGLQQVEQCINRLKNMKLDSALQELADVCPNKIQRGLGIKTGKCEVPSQPMLEWICLKVLGAAQLLSCALTRCSRAFIVSKQHIRWEFVILNMVITSMLSRLWVIFRGVLVGLFMLYHRVLELLRDVAQAQPMPYLTDISLPADMSQFLGPSCRSLLKKHPAHDSHVKHEMVNRQRIKKASVKVTKKRQTGRIKEDLGIVIERDHGIEIDIEPFSKIFKKAKSRPEESHKTNKKEKFKKQVKDAATFAQMAAHLEEMIVWCKSQKMEKEKRLLTFLHLKCHKMKCLEAAGYNVQRKLRSFRREVCWASSPAGSAPKTFHFPVAASRTARQKRSLWTVKRCFVSSRDRTGVKKMLREKTELVVSKLFKCNQQRGATHKVMLQTPSSGSHNDIDDIFASVGL